MAGYTKEELTTIEEMAKKASKDAASSGDDGAFTKYGGIWTKTSSMIVAADTPKKTRTPRAKQEEDSAASAPPVSDGKSAKKGRE